MPSFRTHRRGLTFLEVVAAMALLGIVASGLFGMLDFVLASQQRGRQRLACAEVANRLMLQLLDQMLDLGGTLPPAGSLVRYGPHEYRWEIVESPVQMIDAVPGARDRNRLSPLPMDRFVLVTVRVWLSEESGGSRSSRADVPQVALTRLVDPVAQRNPDAVRNMLANPEIGERFFRVMGGFTGEQGGRGGGRP